MTKENTYMLAFVQCITCFSGLAFHSLSCVLCFIVGNDKLINMASKQAGKIWAKKKAMELEEQKAMKAKSFIPSISSI